MATGAVEEGEAVMRGLPAMIATRVVTVDGANVTGMTGVDGGVSLTWEMKTAVGVVAAGGGGVTVGVGAGAGAGAGAGGGAGGAAVTVMVKVCAAPMSLPPLAVPPLSCTWTEKVDIPETSAARVYVSVPSGSRAGRTANRPGLLTLPTR